MQLYKTSQRRHCTSARGDQVTGQYLGLDDSRPPSFHLHPFSISNASEQQLTEALQGVYTLDYRICQLHQLTNPGPATAIQL